MDLCSDQFTLQPTAPFSFPRSLDFLRRFKPTEGEHTVTSHGLTKAACIDGQTVVFELTDSGSTEAPRLQCTLYAREPIGEQTRAAAADLIASYLSLGDDLRPFYELAREDAAFAPVVERLYGYHQVKFLSAFENACWAILSQRIPMPIARKMKQSLVRRFGNTLTVNDFPYWAFPTAAQVAEYSQTDLAEIVGNQRKAEYLADAAGSFRRVDGAFLRTGDWQAVEEWLRGIRGIGPWSASFILIRGLGRTERVPMVDDALLDAVARVYGTDPPLTPEQCRQILDSFGQWQGYWAHYLRVAA